MGELASIATYNTSPIHNLILPHVGGKPDNLTEISLLLNCSEVDLNPTYMADRLKLLQGGGGRGEGIKGLKKLQKLGSSFH